MKAIMVMFDSLNRHLLPPYGCDWTVAPNFKRLAGHTVTFDHFHIGSMPCMPARREIHTGRLNFLHRAWGPLEPFDDSMPELLRNSGTWTHLVSDHYHYWEDGGATYHNRYSSWEAIRGQEGDQWKADLSIKKIPEDFNPAKYCKTGLYPRQDYINRRFIKGEADMPQRNTFKAGLEFVEKNHSEDNWFLTIECFDPHEPFFTQPEYKKNYEYNYDALGITLDWPDYREVRPGEEKIVEHYRMQYAALLTMCDHYLGTVLDAMDKHELWKDTMLIVNTDHGFLLGEHNWFAKNRPPLYNEIANTPFFIWDPRAGKQGTRNNALCQTIDIAPTLLEYFGQPVPEDMLGIPLRETIANNSPVHDAILFGYHGRHLNITDGRYVYMHAPQKNVSAMQYTLMPTYMRGFFKKEELVTAEMQKPFKFTKGMPVMKIGGSPEITTIASGKKPVSLLFDNLTEPKQEKAIDNPEVVKNLLIKAKALMLENDAPKELYERFALP